MERSIKCRRGITDVLRSMKHILLSINTMKLRGRFHPVLVPSAATWFALENGTDDRCCTSFSLQAKAEGSKRR